MKEYIEGLGKAAKEAAKVLSTSSGKMRNEALAIIAKNLIKNTDSIISENEKDIYFAREMGTRNAMIDRLTLNKERIEAIAKSIESIVLLPDPIGSGSCMTHPNGMRINKLCVPLGTLGIIYEARPNVTVDAAVLSIKSGNAVILKGGKEAIKTNLALGNIIRDSLHEAGLPKNCVQVIDKTDRAATEALFTLKEYIDVLIPRGSASLINAVVQNSTVPVIETGAGNCHLYVDDSADFRMATDILINGKVSRPSVCNALESLLVSRKIASEFLPYAAEALALYAVDIYGCDETQAILPGVFSATQEDLYKEYNDFAISVKIVEDVFEAVEHINKYSTHHSEAIVTKDMQNAEYFKANVDSAAVYVNASTRFTDGGEFGLGAEIGISTQKMHARGPMGLSALTTVKYTIDGNGQVR